MSYISQLHDDFRDTLTRQSKNRDAIQKELKPLKDEFDAYDKQKPEGLWGKLKHQMVKNVGLSPLREKIGQLETKLGNANYAITQKAKDTHKALVDYAMSMPVNAALGKRNAQNTSAVELLANGLGAVTETIAACKTAYDAEGLDIATSANYTQIQSYHATKAARQMLRDTQTKLQDLARRIGDIAPDSGLSDLARDCRIEGAEVYGSATDSSLSNAISLRNRQDMAAAMTALQRVENTLKSKTQQLQQQCKSSVGQAIGQARGIDPEVDALANAITPYLAQDVSAQMTRRASPPAP